MERFVDLSLADIGRTVYRYRPVVAAALAIMVLGLALPGPRRLGQDLGRIVTNSASPTPATQTPAAAVGEVVTAAVPEAGVVPEDSASSFSGGTSFSSAPSSSFAASSDSSFDSASGTSSSPASSSSSGTNEPSRTTTPVAADSVAPSSSSSRRPTIVTTLYASRTAGTPLATNGVPEKSLPVGKQLGQEDKVSFLRLSNAADTLVLKPIAEGDRNAATAAIQMCAVKTVGWSGGEAVAFSAAPERDCTVSVLGTRATDGSWSFDLRPLAGRGGDGFSLSPAPGSPVDFQVAFEATLS